MLDLSTPARHHFQDNRDSQHKLRPDFDEDDQREGDNAYPSGREAQPNDHLHTALAYVLLVLFSVFHFVLRRSYVPSRAPLYVLSSLSALR